MTLTPDTRVLLSDALRPPAGFRIDVAVGATYSLSLTTLLLAPLSFALWDDSVSEDLAGVDPIRLLEAVRRHAAHTTVFCQAGGILVPNNYRSILAFVEDSVLEVKPASKGAIFHPKVWALRFADPAGTLRHRLVVMSRNMTFDQSWDTALVLEESPDGVIPARPAAEFVEQLPGLATRPPGDERLAEINDLVSSLRGVSMAAPTPFTRGELLPMGLNGSRGWPFPERAERLLAITPFLSRKELAALARTTARRTLLSRSETLDRIGSAALAGWDVQVLQRLVETDPADDIAEVAAPRLDTQGASQGLHAKTFVLDLEGSESMVVTGSANLTGRGWGKNVEFDAVLIGPTSECGVAAVLDDRPGSAGLGRVMQGYSPAQEEGAEDAAIATAESLEAFHAELAGSLPNLHIRQLDTERVDAALSCALPVSMPGETSVWLASLASDLHRRPLSPRLSWTIARTSITPFIVVETTAGTGAARATKRSVIKASLSGAVEGRGLEVLRSIVGSKEQVLRYLLFLLGDPSHDDLLAEAVGVADDHRAAPGQRGPSTTEIALLEPLVRAVGRDSDALARVASLVEDLSALPDGGELIPAGFTELWGVVLQVHREGLP